MIWLDLLRRFWKPLAVVVLLIGSNLYSHHAGSVSGHAVSEAHWKPLFAAAERARDAANLAALRKEADSTRLSQTAEAEHAKTVASLNLRAADADQRIRALGVRLATAGARRCEVPAASGATPVPDAAPESDQRASEAGGRIAGTGADCELDAATVIEWQRFYTGLRSIESRPN